MREILFAWLFGTFNSTGPSLQNSNGANVSQVEKTEALFPCVFVLFVADLVV